MLLKFVILGTVMVLIAGSLIWLGSVNILNAVDWIENTLGINQPIVGNVPLKILGLDTVDVGKKFYTLGEFWASLPLFLVNKILIIYSPILIK